jgi:hypothetical protein
MTMWLAILTESSVRVTLAAAAVAVTLAIVRVRSSRARHAAWTAVLLAMLAMPVASFGPGIEVRLPLPAAAPLQFTAMPSAVSASVPAVDPPLARRGASSPVARAQPPAESPQTDAHPVPFWFALLTWTYGLGVAWFACRLLAGVAGVRRLLGASDRLPMPDVPAPVHVSSAVAVPVTIGVFRPRVLLPVDWSRWPPPRRAAVLAHELEHIRRRDPLVLFLAHVNRCLFWFHPLAWWLERTLSDTAEHACDDAGIGAMGSARRYAEVLLDLATARRSRRGRVVSPGIGIDGAGRLGRRIDRILRGDRPRLTRVRAALTAATCLIVIAAALACRQRIDAQPLRPDPKLTALLATRKARQDLYDAAREMTREQAAGAEARLRANPEDLDTLRSLLMFYDVSGQRVLGWNEMIAARRPHVLWLIEHHPDLDMAVSRAVSPKIDPIGYAKAKQLWTTYLTQPAVTPKVLGHAARFFAVADKPVAEQILLRLRREDPDGPTPHVVGDIYYPPWVSQLGSLYGRALVGSDDDTLGNVVKSVSLTEAHGPFAASVRKTLDETTDARRLSEAGWYLVSSASNAHVDFDVRALGAGYLRRALALDPADALTQNRVRWLEDADAEARRRAALLAKEAELAGGDLAARLAAGQTPTLEENRRLTAVEERAVEALPDAERLLTAARLSASTYTSAEYQASVNHPDAAEELWKRSERYARDVLALAPRLSAEPGYGDAVNTANLALSLDALRRGDVKAAVRSMNEAGRTPAVGQSWLESRVVNYLLHAGERDSVAAYLERVAPSSVVDKDRKLADAAAIRSGLMPPSYQSLYAK